MNIRAMCHRVDVTVADPLPTVPGASKVTVRLQNGRVIAREVDEFDGTPNRPLSRAALRDKFMMLIGTSGRVQATSTFERLQNLEEEADLQWVGAF